MPCIDCQRYSAELKEARVQLARAEIRISESAHWAERCTKAVEAVVRLMADLDACSRHPSVDESANARLGISLRDVGLALRALGLNAEVSNPITVTGGSQ